MRACIRKRLLPALIGHELHEINGWELFDYSEKHSALDRMKASYAVWSGVAQKNGYVFVLGNATTESEVLPKHKTNRQYNDWHLECDGKTIARGRIKPDLAGLTAFLFSDAFYRDKKDFLCMSKSDYVNDKVSSLRKKHNETVITAEKRVKEHVCWWKNRMVDFNSISMLIEGIDKAVGGTGSDRLKWERNNCIRKTEEWVKNNSKSVEGEAV